MFNIFKKDKYTFGKYTLDKEQTKAVKCINRALLIVAGAGSGKTLTIVARVNYLIENGIKPDKILCISFTNESVNSLKESLNKNNIADVDVKTFHKLSLDILNQKKEIANDNLLKYITEEYFYSFINYDKTKDLLDFYIKDEELNKKTFLTNFESVIVSFINLFKSYNYDKQYFLNIIKKEKDKDKKILLIVIFKIYALYEEELFCNNKIDFNDIINLAIKKIDKLKYFKYKYVIIDEYQDTSFSKYLLIKKLYDKFNLYLTAVGDDFQSIYSFTGCDLNIFFNFKKNFLNSKIIKLKNTYRCPSDVVNVSSRFVMKNKRQMRKSLHSFKRLKNSIIVVFSKNIISDFIHILEKHNDILVLGRNNKDVLLLIDNDNFTLDNNKIIYTKDESKNITFLTVHSSKGLEGENVVILNVVDDYLGFPNKIEENDLLNYLCTKKKENVLYGEERRLFFVALTRTRNYVYIFTNRFNKSIFVNELLTSYRWKIKIMEFEV